MCSSTASKKSELDALNRHACFHAHEKQNADTQNRAVHRAGCVGAFITAENVRAECKRSESDWCGEDFKSWKLVLEVPLAH